MISPSSKSETRDVVFLKSSNGPVFQEEETTAVKLGTLRELVEAGCCNGGVIPIPNVDSRNLETILGWCKKHADAEAQGQAQEKGLVVNVRDRRAAEELRRWDAEFVNEMGQAQLYELLVATDYLDVT